MLIIRKLLAWKSLSFLEVGYFNCVLHIISQDTYNKVHVHLALH